MNPSPSIFILISVIFSVLFIISVFKIISKKCTPSLIRQSKNLNFILLIVSLLFIVYAPAQMIITEITTRNFIDVFSSAIPTPFFYNFTAFFILILGISSLVVLTQLPKLQAPYFLLFFFIPFYFGLHEFIFLTISTFGQNIIDPFYVQNLTLQYTRVLYLNFWEILSPLFLIILFRKGFNFKSLRVTVGFVSFMLYLASWFILNVIYNTGFEISLSAFSIASYVTWTIAFTTFFLLVFCTPRLVTVFWNPH